MNKLNTLLYNLDKIYPHVSEKINIYGKGKILQVIMSNKKEKELKTKEDARTGLYDNNKIDRRIVEILYENKSEKKKFEKELYEILLEEIKNKIVYVSCISETKNSLLIQLYIIEELKMLEI